MLTKMDVFVGMKIRAQMLQEMVILNVSNMLMKKVALGMKIRALMLHSMVILNVSSMLTKMDAHIQNE